MPCSTGSRPVLKVDQATGLCGGVVVASARNALIAQDAQIGQIGPMALDKVRVHAVDSENDEPGVWTGGQQAVRRSTGQATATRTRHRALPSIQAGGSMPKRSQRGGGQVFDARILGVDFAIAEEHAGHQQGVDAMIAAPGFGVVFDHLRGDFADGGVPTGAIAIVVADDQVRRGVQIGTPVEIAGRVDLADRDLIELFVAEAREPVDQFALQGFGFPARPRRCPALRDLADSDRARSGRAQ